MQASAWRPSGPTRFLRMFMVWVRRDNKANSDKLSSCGGPRLDKVFWRVTRDARTNEVIYSESIHVNFSKSALCSYAGSEGYCYRAVV